MDPSPDEPLPETPVQRPVQPTDARPTPGPSLVRAGPAQADAVLLGAPYDGTSGRRPLQAHAPGVIRSMLGWSSTDAELAVWDAGDVRSAPVAFEPTDARVRQAIEHARSLAPEALVALLGGEHTISLSAVRALEPASIVSLDAHPDLWDDQQGRSIAHGTWLRRAAEELDPEIVLPMARAARGGELDAIDELGVRTELPDALPEPVYLTVDVDVFDPRDAPEVVFPEPGGPTVEAVLETIEAVASGHELVGVDVVEVNANQLGPTARLGARALATAMGAARTRPTREP